MSRPPKQKQGKKTIRIPKTTLRTSRFENYLEEQLVEIRMLLPSSVYQQLDARAKEHLLPVSTFLRYVVIRALGLLDEDESS